MIALACPVRGCHRPLERGERALACEAGHTFDLARSGYCNLLQPQDRRSRTPGDTPEAIAARGRWLARGYGKMLLDALVDRAGVLSEGATVLDLGCGDGFALAGLAERRPIDACGIDISREAIERAVRRLPSATWLVANADRRLPIQDGTTDLVLSVFGRRDGAEIARVLRPGGRAIVVLPAADDLIELRQAVLGQALELDRTAAAIDELAPHLTLLGRTTIRERLELDRAAIEDALAMSYRMGRHSREPAIAALERLEVTQAAELLEWGQLPNNS